MIHPTAIVSEKAQLGHNVSIGAYAIIYDNVILSDNVTIGAYCEIGYPTPLAEGEALFIGPNALIRSHCIFYEGSTFGSHLVTGHRACVREKTRAGSHLQIGTGNDIQGYCTIGNYVKFHSNVNVGQFTTIGNYVWIYPSVYITNDPHPPSHVLQGVTIEDFAIIATMSVLLPGVTIKKGALVAAHSSVNKDVEADTLVAGAPAKFICQTSKLKLKDGSSRPAYPWRSHFHRGYPATEIKKWLEEFAHDERYQAPLCHTQAQPKHKTLDSNTQEAELESALESVLLY